MTIIILVAIVIYAILITWIWKSLGYIEKSKKILYIAVGLLIMYIITLIIFNISKNGITYQNIESEKIVRNVLVLIFTSLNGMITLPYIGRLLNKVNEDEITKKAFSKKVLILIIVFIVCLTFECGYLKDTQTGINVLTRREGL